MAVVTATLIARPLKAFAAIGCTLSNPAADIKYLYPEMTSYKEELKEFPRLKDGVGLFKALKERLGGDFDPIYENFETPYTLYSVFKGRSKIGIVHGVNVPGKGGVIQVFLSMDPKTAAIGKLFFQRFESPAAAALRDKAFRARFEGLTLADFDKNDHPVAAPEIGADGRSDYDAALRGVRKNLVLLDLFVFNGGRR